MCGIIAYIGHKPVVPVLIAGLRRLEYRGYDSAGVALVHDGSVEIRRSAGKLSQLEATIATQPVDGDYGLGHTRWATHGRPTEENAHPHRDCTGRVVVVHNGIIENYLELKHELAAQGHQFATDTDTEVIAHLVERELRDDGLEHAVRRALQDIQGLFGLVILSADEPHKLVAARNGPPVLIGIGDREFLVASDVPPILSHTREVVFLGDQEMATITLDGPNFTDFTGAPVETVTQRVTWDPVMAEKAGYKHFMLKEIFEQPWAAQETLLGRASLEPAQVFLGELEIPETRLRAIERIVILACGTSWHAALVGKFVMERIVGVPVEIDYGSEYRYRDPIVTPTTTLVVVITQSGETADTLAALREARNKGATSIAICNVVGSMATREADGTVYTHAGPEIGVAATKTFTAQLVALHLLALYLAHVRHTLAPDAAREHLDMVGIDLLTVARMQAKMDGTTTAGGITEHSISWLVVTMGELAFSDFDTNVEMDTAESDAGPYAETAIDDSCLGYYPCDWLWGQAFDPLSIYPDDTTLEMDNSYASGAQRGVNVYAAGGPGALPEIDGAVETTWADGPAYLMVDLLVEDLPATWVTANGDNVRVVARIGYGVYYYGVYVPAMSLRGGAVLVMAVLAAGLLALALPRKRAA